MIGMLGTYQTRIARTDEGAAAGEGGALRDQRFDERLRLGAGLTPNEGVARTDDAREIDVQRSSPWSSYDAGSEIGSMWVKIAAFGTMARMRASISSDS